MKISFLTTVAAFALLAACSDNPAPDNAAAEGVDQPAEIETAETDPAPQGNQADQIMGPAAGMWDMDITAGGTQLPTTSICYDETLTLAEMERQQRQAGADCSKQDYRRDGAAIVGQSVCQMNGATIVVDQRITGDMRTRYRAEMVTTMDPPPAPGAGTQEMTIIATRTGDC